MAEPNGTVVGTVTMEASGTWWRATRYQVGTRSRFHVVQWRTHGTGTIQVLDRVTDDMWDPADADLWVQTAVQANRRAGFILVQDQTNGNPGPVGP